MTFDDWKQNRLQHVRATKQQDESDCKCCVEWVWHYLDECVCGTAQITGWYFVIIAIVLFIFSGLSCKKSQTSHVGFSLVSLLVSFTGLIGAFLSMQMTIVVAYDATYVLVDLMSLVVMVVCHVTHSQKRNRERHRYQQIPNDQNQATSRRESTWKIICFGSLSISLMSLVSSWQVLNPVEIRKDLQFQETQNFTLDDSSIGLVDLLMVVGYTMGSLACFGQWAIQWYTIRIKQEYLKERANPGDSVISVVLRSILVVSRTLYVTGVLFQSGGWMITMVSLPWTVKSIIGALAECCDIVLSLRNNFQHNRANNKDDSDVISLTESGSDTSNILWDKAWKIPGGLDQFPYYEKTRQAKPKCFDVQALRLLGNNNNISTNSDWSSSSDEQELEWEHAGIAPYNPPAKERKIRMERIMNSTPPRLIPLTLSMPESSDQRVITWISNSTPEDEKPPTLTMTLNLDPSPQTSNDLSMIGDSRTFPSRKYSL